MKIVILYGSVRQNRQGIKAAEFLKKRVETRGHQVTLIDPLDDRYMLPFLDKMHKEFDDGEAPENIERIGRALEEADGFLIVTGEYNHSVPPALKNLLDHYQKEYLFKPSAIACYSAGSFGGVRSSVHLRVILGELGTPSISSILPFPKVQDAFDEKGDPVDDKYYTRTDRFLDEFEWYLDAMKQKRAEGSPF